MQIPAASSSSAMVASVAPTLRGLLQKVIQPYSWWLSCSHRWGCPIWGVADRCPGGWAFGGHTHTHTEAHKMETETLGQAPVRTGVCSEGPLWRIAEYVTPKHVPFPIRITLSWKQLRKKKKVQEKLPTLFNLPKSKISIYNKGYKLYNVYIYTYIYT